VIGAAKTLVSLPLLIARRQKEQWLPRERLAAIRLRRIRVLLDRARAASYYGGILSGINLSEDDHPLESVPLLDKGIMREFGEAAFLTDGNDGLLPVFTSGSTGQPARFLRSTVEEAEFSSRWYRVHSAYGGRFRDTILNIGRVGAKPRRGPARLLRTIGILPAVRNISVAAPIAESVQILEDMEPQFVVGYAVGVENLARYIIAQGITVNPPKAVFCGAMDVTDRCRELVGQAFNAPAVNVYASNEFGVVGWECPVRRESLHVNDDALIMEILDENGMPVPDGTVGEVVLTSLTLERMPLIRYRTGDMAARLPGECVCGRGLGLMTVVKGRTSHTITGPKGEQITAPLVSSALSAANAYRWVSRFQLREQESNCLRLLVVPSSDPLPAQVEVLMSQLTTTVGPSYRIDLELREDLPLAPSGKYQYVVPLPASPGSQGPGNGSDPFASSDTRSTRPL
jgi:phenylacetate-CoA ligase